MRLKFALAVIATAFAFSAHADNKKINCEVGYISVTNGRMTGVLYCQTGPVNFEVRGKKNEAAILTAKAGNILVNVDGLSIDDGKELAIYEVELQ